MPADRFRSRTATLSAPRTISQSSSFGKGRKRAQFYQPDLPSLLPQGIHRHAGRAGNRTGGDQDQIRPLTTVRFNQSILPTEFCAELLIYLPADFFAPEHGLLDFVAKFHSNIRGAPGIRRYGRPWHSGAGPGGRGGEIHPPAWPPGYPPASAVWDRVKASRASITGRKPARRS